MNPLRCRLLSRSCRGSAVGHIPLFSFLVPRDPTQSSETLLIDETCRADMDFPPYSQQNYSDVIFFSNFPSREKICFQQNFLYFSCSPASSPLIRSLLSSSHTGVRRRTYPLERGEIIRFYSKRSKKPVKPKQSIETPDNYNKEIDEDAEGEDIALAGEIHGGATKAERSNRERGRKTGNIEEDEDPVVVLIENLQNMMNNDVEAFVRELNKLRTGRATPGLLDHINVEAYGIRTPLNVVATVSVKDANNLYLMLYDKNLASAVCNGLLNSPLNLNPIADAKSETTFIVPVPKLTREVKESMLKLLSKLSEGGKIALRRTRKLIMDDLKKLKKDKMISEDEAKRAEKKVESVTNRFLSNLEGAYEAKKKQLM